MKLNQFLTSGTLLAGLLFSQIGTAGVISVSGVELDAIDLDSTSATSFKDYYQFGTVNSWSSNTGLEIANEVVVFIGSLQNELALYVIAGGIGGDAGTLGMGIVGSEAGITFVDDPGGRDPITSNSVSWTYAADKTDGLIFSPLTSDIWNIDLEFYGATGLNAINFLTFDSANNASAALRIDGSPQGQFSIVSAPANVINAIPNFGTLGLIMAGLFGLRARSYK